MSLSWSVTAFNTATQSENRIHDDETAARFGFTGGLVPGVDVFAYMTHLPRVHFGPRWLSEGRMQARFHAPTYDGRPAVTSGTAAPGEGRLKLDLSSDGRACASGWATMHTDPCPAYILPSAPAPARESRPPASPDSLAPGSVLGSLRETYTTATGLEYLEAVRETAELYDGGRLAHPGWLLRKANQILEANVRLGPWIHVESDMRLFGEVRTGGQIDVRAVVGANYETKGHRIVELDVQLLCEGSFAMCAHHIAIYERRQVRQAAGGTAQSRA